ncbi:MAG: 3-phenylpropionate/trans-cinnamate dioxygenase ferredoxin reductase subunit [Paracoccaceae bacterium]|jgi:3-phenylpropionate/trans-cinnamate dioxygenase ferredoxin reductase subunit
MSHIVVIGAGQAGSSLVVKLRNLGFEGQVTLIGSEDSPPYQRPPLSKKYLLGELELERLYLRPHTFYGEHDISLKLGASVTGVDTASKTISLGGETLSYDHLAFTTGSDPRRLPAAIGGELDGVYAVRSLADVDAMAPNFVEGRKLLIIGGGYIGLEAAAVAAKRGLQVVLVEMADRILQRVAAPETSNFFRELHASHGVDIREGIGLKRLTGEGHVSGADLSDGSSIEVDFVIAGVGIMPSTGLAEIAGLAIDNGIHTDAFGRSSVENVWAAGDCASFPYKGERIRLESVPNAIDQAEIVAANMMGAEKEYLARPWFWSDQYDVKLQIAGLNVGYDNIVTRAGDKATSFWYYAGDKLLAVDAMNDPRAYMIGKRMIEGGISPNKTMVADASSDLKSLLK